MTWTEKFVDNFNSKEKVGLTNIIVPCLTKLGRSIYDSKTKPFDDWLESLNEHSLYKALLEAHSATDI